MLPDDNGRTSVLDDRWVTGDIYGLSLPAEPEGLLEGGPDFLTRAFRAFGAMSPDNSVVSIKDSDAFFGGGSGRKMMLTVEYEFAEPNLPEQLFVKFSRNFYNELWDSARFMMVSEARLANLARVPGFPVTVPRAQFADVDSTTGTGLTITECIPYGRDGVEPLHLKCMDYTVANVLEHYKTILGELARLSGAHRSGRLAAEFDQYFPYSPEKALESATISISEEKLLQRAHKLFDFMGKHPQLFPDNVRTPELHETFIHDIPDLIAKTDVISKILCGNPDFVAFAHWNANIDNCWFWRDDAGELHCGFIDWGNAGPMSVARAICGSIGSGDPEIWNEHLDELLQWFISEYSAHGGPSLDLDELRLHVLLHSVVGAVAFGMGAPVALRREIDDLDSVTSYRDDCFLEHENSRIQLHGARKFLDLWQTYRLGDLVRSL